MRSAACGALTLLAGIAFAVVQRRRASARRIIRISRVVADLDRAEAFYRDGLGFRRVARGPGDPAVPARLGLPGATTEQVVLRLGAEEIALVRFDPPGARYPADSRSDDLWFQHLAIVVDNMAAACQRLAAQSPRAISTDGPERLPPRNGSVAAFKFRDPDGHPLELIQFPPGQGRPVWQHAREDGRGSGPFLGIDHSAMAVAATARSLRFYRRLGLRVASRSLNDSAAQARLDGVPGARVRVTGLRFPAPIGPGLELLCYTPPGRPAAVTAANAAVTDWVMLSGRRAEVWRDPDGHIMVLSGRS